MFLPTSTYLWVGEVGVERTPAPRDVPCSTLEVGGAVLPAERGLRELLERDSYLDVLHRQDSADPWVGEADGCDLAGAAALSQGSGACAQQL
jgi:hypothetical protein